MGEIVILLLVVIPLGISSFISWKLGRLKDEINKELEDLEEQQ